MTGNGFDVNTIVTSGIGPVLIATLFLTGQIVRGKTYDAMEQRALKAEERAQKLADQAITDVVPAVTRTAEVLNRVVPLLTQSGLG